MRLSFLQKAVVGCFCLTCVVLSNEQLYGLPATPGIGRARSLAKGIDRALRQSLTTAGDASDAVFLRRVYLDLTGRIPSIDISREFLASKEKNKRERIVDRLLDSGAWTELWARVWCEILLGDYRRTRARIGDKRLDGPFAKKRFEAFRDWLRDQFAVDEPWPEIVSHLVESVGDLSQTPPLYYKAAFLRGQPDAMTLADGVSRSFLGVRIDCARCHDHPFDRWTREDYFGLAAFFTHIEARAEGGDTATEVSLQEVKETVAHLPEGRNPPPQFFFGGRGDGGRPRLPQLALFLKQQEQQLARNVVNRTWAVLFGSGFVEPLDDFSRQNRPQKGALLERLTKEFVRNRASLRFLLRAICYSRAYGRDLGVVENDWLGGGAVRQLMAEQLFQSLVAASGGSDETVDFTSRTLVRRRGEFYKELRPVFPAGKAWTEVTRLPGNSAQVLFLQNGGTMKKILRRSKLVYRLRKSDGDPVAIVEEAFLAVLCRFPTTDETERYVKHLERSEGRARYEDLVWALFNSAEFTTLH